MNDSFTNQETMLDCAIIGGGPAGLNAALVLGRSMKKTILFDDNQPRNRVTHESHGFLTRDGINPQELKRLAQQELTHYPDVQVNTSRVATVAKEEKSFRIETEGGEVFHAKKVILATGFTETLPDIPRMQEFYGTSLFSCPFCDGYEMRGEPLVIISENEAAGHLAKVVSNWTNNLIIATNGKKHITPHEQKTLEHHGVLVYEDPIRSLDGEHGKLRAITFEDGTTIERSGGFVTAEWHQSTSIAKDLGCYINERGGVETDPMQRTNVEGVFACGDISMGPAQLIIAAGQGSLAATSVVAAFTEERFGE